MESHLALPADYPASMIIDAARAAEDMGVDGLWITDVRFARDCFVVLGACATATSRIRLAVGVNDPFSRHPAALAAAYATLSELAPDRLIIGLGAGGSGLDRIGVKRSQPRAVVSEAIDVIRGMLAGQSLTSSNAGFVIENGQLTFAPVGRLPVALVAHGPRMYGLAGEKADVAVIANYATAIAISSARDNIGEGQARRAADLDPLRLCWRVDVSVAENADEARAVMRRRVEHLLRTGYYSAAFLEPLGLSHAAGVEPTPSIVEDVVTGVAFAGTSAEVTDRMRPLLMGSDFDMICWRAYPVEGQTLTESITACHAAIQAALTTRAA